ncbi:MAG: TonB family protein, partial [bacterium]
ERTAPFPASYTYRYTGLKNDTTSEVELITNLMQRTYRSHFHYPSEGEDVTTIGPYEVRIISADSSRIVFELKGYVQLPEAKEEVAEAKVPADTGLVALVQSQIEALPKSSKEYFSRAYIRATEGNYDEAKRDLQTALEMDSSFFEARLLLGWILLEQNDNRAVEQLRRCKKLKPDDPTGLYFTAYSLERFGSSDEAFDSYKSIVERDSTDERALFQLASIYEARGDSLKGAELLEKARGFRPNVDSISVTPALSEIPHEFWWVEEMPRLTHFEQPEYPEIARKESLECVVIVSILVDEKGNAADVKIYEPCGDVGFNEGAQAAAHKCTFTPGKQQGKPVKVWVNVPFRFELAEREADLAGSERPKKGVTEREVAFLDSVEIEEAALPHAGVVEPQLVEFVQPEYPQQALKDRVETTVLLNVLVGRDGSVNHVTFVQPDTLNVGFNEAAEAAARRCRFRPGLRDGAPDTMWVELPIAFTLPSTPSPHDSLAATPGETVTGEGETPIQPKVQNRASAYVEATMLAQKGDYDEALQILKNNLEPNPRDQNGQLLLGLITLAKESGKRMEEVTPLVQGPKPDEYWWVDTMPQMEEFREAIYPKEAEESRAEGTVLLYVLVDERGAVQKVTVVNPADEPSLNAAAEQAARECTFAPGTLQGEPVKVWTPLPYTFRLSE